jgi:hypothetical protein
MRKIYLYRMGFQMSLKDRIIKKIAPGALISRMLTGALIGFIIICFFVFSVHHPNPDWPPYWRIKPLIVAPLAGAFGILSFYLKLVFPPGNPLINVLLTSTSILAFVIALWTGVVLGLNGTLWN